MSGTQATSGGGAPTGNDPSMEDILASIRRILSEDEPTAAPASTTPVAEPSAAEAEPDDVLVLDNTMLVADPEPAPASEPEPEELAEPEPVEPAGAAREPPATAVLAPPPEATLVAAMAGPNIADLLAPEAAAAATSSVSSLMRTLATGRSTAVYHGGPTIEDIVREEVRPLLKQWLDTNLPPLVERLVRAEIERVVARAVP